MISCQHLIIIWLMSKQLKVQIPGKINRLSDADGLMRLLGEREVKLLTKKVQKFTEKHKVSPKTVAAIQRTQRAAGSRQTKDLNTKFKEKLNRLLQIETKTLTN